MPYTEKGVGFKSWDTSRIAAKAAEPRAPVLRAQIMAALRDKGQMTGAEIAEKIGSSILSVRPRLTELSHSGMIEDTGVRRKNEGGHAEIVWQTATRKS